MTKFLDLSVVHAVTWHPTAMAHWLGCSAAQHVVAASILAAVVVF